MTSSKTFISTQFTGKMLHSDRIMEGANMTDREYYRLNGCLSDERTRALLDKNEDLQREIDNSPDVEEILAQIPGEDFLDTPLRLLSALRVRGDTLEKVGEIMTVLKEIRDSQSNAGGYAYSIAAGYYKRETRN